MEDNKDKYPNEGTGGNLAKVPLAVVSTRENTGEQ